MKNFGVLLMAGLFTFTTFTARGWENGMALTPPMGWNGWYAYEWMGRHVTAGILTNVIETMHTNGLFAAGYKYVNLDDCWQMNREGDGFPTCSESLFPNGISVIADHAHSKGMLFGIYYMAGLCSWCTTNPLVGSYGHEVEDAAYAAAVGADFMKFDLTCRGGGEDQLTAAIRMRDLVASCGRPMVYQSGGYQSNYWKGVCNQFRVGADIEISTWISFTRCLDEATNYLAQIGPGSWADPDMINIGGPLGGDLSRAEKRSYFGMWCMLPAPLILSNDPAAYTAEDLALLTHPEAIAINQDTAGKAMSLIQQKAGVGGNLEVWRKDLGTAKVSKAVALFNRSSSAAEMTVNFAQLGLGTGPVLVRDIWKRADLGYYTNRFTVSSVASHDTLVLKLTPVSHLPLKIEVVDGKLGFFSGRFGFTLSGPVGQPVIIQVSSNLVEWIACATNSLGSGGGYFFDPEEPAAGPRFYRLLVPVGN